MADSAVKVLIGQERSRNHAHMDPGPDLSVWRPWAGEWWGAGVSGGFKGGPKGPWPPPKMPEVASK